MARQRVQQAAKEGRFRPYPGLPSEQERIQAIRDFLQWIYSVYVSRDQFLRDFHVVLRSLRAGEGSTWGSGVLVEFVEKLPIQEMQNLQQEAPF